MKYGRVVLGGLGVAIGVLAACGGSDETSSTGGNTGTGASSTTGTATGTGTGTTGAGAGTGVGGSFSTGTTTGAGGSCAGETKTAELVPLDIYIMLDASGSMLDKTGMMGQGVPKWDAVTDALTTFFDDPQSSGIGAGLQYFPVTAAGAPSSCSSQADCGQFGPCLLKICQNDTGIVCSTNQDCGAAGPCVNLGQCQNDPATFCLPIGANCPGMKGPCVQVTQSICLAVDSCDAADYATPAVEIDTLNAAAPQLIASMTAKSPEGATPTSSALQGAIDHAAAWAAAHPTHKVVAVLATDGLPTECAPTDIAGIAAIAAAGVAGTPSVPTFVIGVFSGNDQAAQADLDQIAASGGTGQAYFIDVNGNVGQAFLDALHAIQGTSLACEYQIPAPPPGETLDYNQVNVEHTPPGAMAPETVFYVGDAANCDPTTGGWYYDVDPAQGGTPTTILMCPATCDAFGQGGQVDIRLGCATVIKPPS